MASSRSYAPSSARQPPSHGCESPRIFTPPLLPLTPATTAGHAFVEFARDVLGMELLPWQRWLALHALELLPDGTFRFRTILVLTSRQSGKSTFLQLLALFFLYVRGAGLVIGTAQSLDIAEEVWQGAVDIAEGVPELAAEIERVVLVNGKKSLELVRGERYRVQSANRRGGRGLSGDLVLLDELREHQSWDAWAAVTKTTLAREHAQVWATSNAGDAASVVLAYLRRLAHAPLGDPDGLAAGDPEDRPALGSNDSLAVFEWSAAPGCALDDPQAWAQANPALGYTITPRAVASALQTDPEPVFRTEVLCQWVHTITASAIDEGVWASLADPRAERGPSPSFAVATAPDRSWAALAVAWRPADGAGHVSLVDYRPGASWVPARVAEVRERWGGSVYVDTASRGLVPDAVELSQADQAKAHNALSDAAQAGLLGHGNEPAMRAAVRGARWKPSGDTRVLDRKAGVDISPLVAAALALHGTSTPAQQGGWMISLP